jgi:hypothetical protein
MSKLAPTMLLLALLMQGGCKTKDVFQDLFPAPSANPLDQLPPETRSGQGTFGCLVNGQAWTPAGNPFGGPLLTAVYANSRLGISANRAALVNGASSFQVIGFAIKNIQSIGTYALDDSLARVGSYEDFNTSCKFYTSQSQVGTVEITRLDPVARIVSSRFSFTLETPGCGQVVVNNGRFDSRF